jgi:hypothetical protein
MPDPGARPLPAAGVAVLVQVFGAQLAAAGFSPGDTARAAALLLGLLHRERLGRRPPPARGAGAHRDEHHGEGDRGPGGARADRRRRGGGLTPHKHAGPAGCRRRGREQER